MSQPLPGRLVRWLDRRLGVSDLARPISEAELDAIARDILSGYPDTKETR